MGMNWNQIQAEATELVEDMLARNSDLVLTEYHDVRRYRREHPKQWPMRVHNAIIRAALREATRRDVLCVRRIAK